MTTLFTVLIVICAILMILVVLVQKSKGGGLASSFSSTNSILGVKKTTDGVEKATWILASTIIVLSIATVSMTPRMTHKPSVAVPVAPVNAIPDMSTELPIFPAPSADDSNE